MRDILGRSWEIAKEKKVKKLICDGKECGHIGPKFTEKDLKDHVKRENIKVERTISRETREANKKQYESGKSPERRERERVEKYKTERAKIRRRGK
jgi:hypothetical protein